MLYWLPMGTVSSACLRLEWGGLGGCLGFHLDFLSQTPPPSLSCPLHWDRLWVELVIKAQIKWHNSQPFSIVIWWVPLLPHTLHLHSCPWAREAIWGQDRWLGSVWLLPRPLLSGMSDPISLGALPTAPLGWPLLRGSEVQWLFLCEESVCCLRSEVDNEETCCYFSPNLIWVFSVLCNLSLWSSPFSLTQAFFSWCWSCWTFLKVLSHKTSRHCIMHLKYKTLRLCRIILAQKG